MFSSDQEFTNGVDITEGPDLNAIRRAVVCRTFKQNINRRVLLLQESFPFLFIGKIKAVEGDFLKLKVEVTNITEFDGEMFRIHLDTVQVFYIEDDKHVIPDIRG